MDCDDRRLFVGALCAISLSLATALLIGQHIEPHGSLAVWWDLHWPQLRHLLARKNFATGIQAIGTLVTFYGLARAYVRAKDDLTVWQWVKRKLGLEQRAARAHSGTAKGTYGWTAFAHVEPSHDVDITLPYQEQIKRLARFVNSRAKEAVEMERKIAGIEQQLTKLEAGAIELKHEVVRHIESQIQQLDDKINRVAVLDLTLAIRGLGIAFLGTVLSFGT